MTRREYEVTDPAAIREIFEKCHILHLGLVDDGMPYIIPMNYGVEFVDDKPVLYLHGSTDGYKMNVIRKNPTCCFEMECEVQPFEGRIACQYGMTYNSLIGRGKVVIIDDVEEKIHAMKVLMKTQTGKDFDFTDRLVSIVSIMRIEIDTYSAKHRPMPAAPV